MSDTECDLETLTALLDEDEGNEDKICVENGNAPDSGDASNGNQKYAGDSADSSQISDDEGNFDELSALLSDSDDEPDDGIETTQESNKSDGDTHELERNKITENTSIEHLKELNETDENNIDQNGAQTNKTESNHEQKQLDSTEKQDDKYHIEEDLNDCKTNSTGFKMKSEEIDSNNSGISKVDNDVYDINGSVRSETGTREKTDIASDEKHIQEDGGFTGTHINGQSRNKADNGGVDDFEDFYDSDMEEMVKSIENQPDGSAESQCDTQSVVQGDVVNASENFLGQCDEETEVQYDSEDSERLEALYDKQESQTMETEASTSEHEEDENKTEQPDDTDTLSKEVILAEMKKMSERMKQLENLLVKSESKSEPSASVSNKINNNKNTNTKKTQILEKKAKGVTSYAAKGAVNKFPLTATSKKNKTDNAPIRNTVSSKERTNKNGSEMNKVVPETKNAKQPKKFDRSGDRLKNPTAEKPSVRKEDHCVEKRPKSSNEKGEDGDNPFFAATPCSEDSDLLSTDPRSLFGDSDDSDWDELDGEKKSNLNDEGRQIKKLLNKGSKQRVAHKPNYDTSVLKKSPPARWTSHSAASNHKPARKTKPVVIKPQLDPETGTVSGKYTLREEYKPKPVTPQFKDVDEKDVQTDPYCGIKIINPRISMADFKSKMSGRTMIKVSHIQSKVGRGDLQKDNWVTIGVVVHRTEPRQSAAGKSFCIWKLSDLIDCDKTVSFFLFGNVYKEHWKNDLGTVIGLLNPTMMDKAEKVQSELAFTINHPQQLLVMGHSKDLGRCKGTTKAGNPCSHFINKSKGEFCTYHVQAAYRKSSAKRTELQASTGITPKVFTDKGKKSSKESFFFYGGQTFTTMKPQAKSSKDQVTLKKLQHAEAHKGAQKVTTMSLHELEPEDEMKFRKMEDKDAGLLEKLMVPTVGSMNLVKHLVKKDKPKQTDTSKQNEPQMESVSAKDLLKQHQLAMKQRLAERKQSNPLNATPTLGKGFGVGQDISLDVPLKRSSSKSAELAKRLAIAKLKEKGGIEKEDPNAVRKKLTSPEQKEKIRKRVAEDIGLESKNSDPESSEPPRKRSRFLGNVDINDPEVQKLLKSRSKHKGALAEAEAEHEEKYFMALEKKEKMEEKMDSVMEVEVKLFRCKQCQYTAFSLADRCKKGNHDYKVGKGMKRFFKCKQCKKRRETCEKFPTKPCQDCGSTSYERVSMLKERSGPKLESEELSLRGNEQKYLGSLNQKSFLNV